MTLPFNPNNPKDVVIRRQVQSVEFGFYIDRDVRDRSVIEVTSSQAFDPTGSHALPGGLYDPRMGPAAKEGKAGQPPQPCPTCALMGSTCPGHWGHIELAVPVYQPILFPELLQLLKLKCFHCHRLRPPARVLAIFRAKFNLVATHRVAELQALDGRLAVAQYRSRTGASDPDDDDDDDDDDDAPSSAGAAAASSSPSSRRVLTQKAAAAMDDVLRDLQPPKTGGAGSRDSSGNISSNNNNRTKTASTRESSYERSVRRELVMALIGACKKCKSCQHCGAYSPKIRHDSNNKVFQQPLASKFVEYNAGEGIELESALLAGAAAKNNTQQNPQDDEEQQQRPQQQQSGYDSDDTAENVNRGDDPMDTDDDDDDDDDSSSGGSNKANDGKDTNTPDEEDEKSHQRDRFMHAREVQAQIQRTWETDPFLCTCLFGRISGLDHLHRRTGSGSSLPLLQSQWNGGYQKFFMQAIAVPPNRFRPAMHLNGVAVEHTQTQYLSKMIQLNEQIRNHFTTNNEARAYQTWIDLQTTVNCFMDSSKDPSASAAANIAPGIRQLMERKEGLFRKNMMGKRVDFACRSVISPDPYVGTNEIGLPQYFATVLTYPTPVTEINAKEMRQLVERGVQYPGARWVEFGRDRRRLDLSKMNRQRREAIAAQLVTDMKRSGGMPATVGRQLRDGDYVLMNRQPTLHKPGIMAHRVRVLHSPTQKTIRMHYANCNTYNADYDGDEMNCHFVQNDLARAEAQYIAQTDLQYIVPTDGSPLRGLIQDHVVGGVKLTKKDTFLEKWEYQQLLFAALTSLSGLELIRSDADIELVPPAIIRPRELWTGKQVISTLLLHLRKSSDRDIGFSMELPGLSTERKSKTPGKAFGEQQDEHLVLVRDGELLRGVLDKAAFGSTDFSLVHAVYEAYGPEKAGLLLNAFGRLFTAYIQYYSGHSCRMEDLVLTTAADKSRRDLVQRAYNIGSRAAKAWADADGGKVEIPPVGEQPGSDRPLKPVEAASAAVKIGQLLSGNDGKENFAALDAYMQGQLNPLASEIVKTCLPDGLNVPFPYNTFGVMTTTGAKGSIVNQSQVTCALGQQALEGRRVPRTSSGRTLPSFAPFDPHPRADGFVMDRFLTGVRPQEYYFHCMAGREGLVDTAVKTSRSGYLQRCLIKHLEELKICYDYTVRNAEGGVVQFVYGEDGLDPTKASYLDCTNKSFEFMARNHEALKRSNRGLPGSTIDLAAQIASHNQAVQDAAADYEFKVGEQVAARRLRVSGGEWKRGALCKGWHQAIITRLHDGGKLVDLKYLDDGYRASAVPVETDLGGRGVDQVPALTREATIVKPAAIEPILSSLQGGNRLGVSGACVSERVAASAAAVMDDRRLTDILSSAGLKRADLSQMIAAKYGSSLCAPGEAVGSIAAQSVGEPSTQMTLNTFHLAGCAGANVTLGIPRLREIIMTASRDLKTPTMSVPLREQVTDRQATRLARKYTRLSLKELILGNRGISVAERLEKGDGSEWSRSYYVTLKFHAAERIREAFGLSLHEIAQVVAKDFVPALSKLMKRELRRAAVDGDVNVEAVRGGSATAYSKDDSGDADAEDSPANADRGNDSDDDDDDNDDDDDDVLGEEDGADVSKSRSRKEGVSYDEEAESDADDGTDNNRRPATSAPLESDDESDEDEDETDPFFDGKSANNGGPIVNLKNNSILLQPLSVDPSSRPIMMVGLVETAATATLVRSRKKIQEAFVTDEDGGRGRCLQTAGVNFAELWKLPMDVVDHDKLASNDIWALCCSYGVEAARNNIVEQIRSVFGVYGIEVDPRHLSLIADYMTLDGGFRPMNRKGMEANASAFLQMSFETTLHFLRQAAIANDIDELTSPSANIVLGKPIRHGTGSFTCLASVG